ncbi:SprT-like domain-containing protein [Rubripirellula sp.]|nr:SprT-like domain-containing protein [Rubripirellula sp.]MDB4338866.1 SprT-like domain-containing protein [Rubripirellula sp.]
MKIVPRTMAGIQSGAQSLRGGANRLMHRLRGSATARDRSKLNSLAGEVALRTFEPDVIRGYQEEIFRNSLQLSRTFQGPNFNRVGRDDLVRMVKQYDERFFGGKVLPLAKAEGLDFSISSRMTKVAGKLVTHYENGTAEGRRRFEMVLSSTLLFQTFEDSGQAVEVTGRLCRNRLEAMQRVVEHEFVHLVEMLIWNDGNCNESRFQSIAKRYFAHTDYRHSLITQRERAAMRFNVRLGDQVRFKHEGRFISGRVNRITRRATVLVPSDRGQLFCDGKRYQRFYVPLEKLKKVG